MKVHLVRLLLLCYITQGGSGGVSFANKNVSGLQKYLRFQNEYNKVEIELCVVQFWTEMKLVITNRSRFAVVRFCNHAFDFSPNCTPLSSITIINCTLQECN